MKNILTLIILILIGLLIFIYSGIYNIAATKPHTKLVLWIMHTTMERSVKTHAKGINTPTLDESLVKTGFDHYSEMCEGCHGKPGLSPSEMKTGFYHEPPDLSKGIDEWSPAELFWIIKNGIKMSAMPAFGPTHKDEELWAIVAFLRRLPDLSPDEYKEMEKAAQGKPGEHGQSHEH
ncbi:MAG: cytochrome C class I protein [Candidatus Dadabacteria bacterium CSP1-2]|nr:MAG: cytochrome C class I protein [Candidatus Dadabacteria bacterium CSP1-2]MBF8302732.1 Cytochrome class protein [Candidatus Dadabacteria bacterium]